MFKKVCFTVVLLLLAATVALAHDTWLERKDGELQVIYGHGKEHDPYDPSSVRDAKGIDAKGGAVAVPILSKKETVTLDPKEKPAIVAWGFNGGHHVKTTDGWKKMGKREAQGKYQVIESVRGEKYCKAFLAKSDSWSKPVGHLLEIVPQKDPTSVVDGDVLPILVLFEGKPLEGAKIVAGEEKKSESEVAPTTDKQGLANVPVGKGQQFIAVRHRPAVKGDPDADALALSAAITFGIDPH
jgi:nickel transport protein